MQCKACGAEMVKGRLVSTSWARLFSMTVLWSMRARRLRAFLCSKAAFGSQWWNVVTQYHTIALPGKVIVIPVDRKSTRL